MMALNMSEQEPHLEREPAVEPTLKTMRPWYKDWLIIPTMLVVLGADQLSKHLIRANLAVGQSIPSEGTFRIHHIHNTGGVFGFFTDQTFLLVIASLIAVPVLLFLYRQYPFSGTLLRLALGLQLGGAIGNLIDRLWLGYVTDFIRLGWWPIFNLADSSMIAGIVILVGLFLLTARKKEGSQPPEGEDVVSHDGPPGTDG